MPYIDLLLLLISSRETLVKKCSKWCRMSLVLNSAKNIWEVHTLHTLLLNDGASQHAIPYTPTLKNPCAVCMPHMKCLSLLAGFSCSIVWWAEKLKNTTKGHVHLIRISCQVLCYILFCVSRSSRGWMEVAFVNLEVKYHNHRNLLLSFFSFL